MHIFRTEVMTSPVRSNRSNTRWRCGAPLTAAMQVLAQVA